MPSSRVSFHCLRLVTLVVFLLSLAVGAFAADTAPADRLETQHVIDQQIGAFRAGDNEKAYSFAAPGIKQVFPTVERFIDMVTSGYMPVYDPESYVFGRSIDQGGQIHQEVIVTDRNGKTWQAVYTLQKQADDTWKITSVKLNPYKGASA
ncbi:MAG: DUF4864 domain-containing protein [Salaquimonas sp.]|nr:DUF4864 domain-containing protein [Salaquimonas sp.]